jgi:hypothetical protein
MLMLALLTLALLTLALLTYTLALIIHYTIHFYKKIGHAIFRFNLFIHLKIKIYYLRYL